MSFLIGSPTCSDQRTSRGLQQKLDEWLEQTLKRELKIDKIERDEDGDIPIPCGSAVAFIRAFDEDPLASISSHRCWRTSR